jgi:AcrR family transcriptional regulator
MRKPGSSGAQTLGAFRSAAIELIAEHGYEAMNLRMLADSAGVTPASMYIYFASKQELLFSILQEVTKKLLNELAAIVERVEDPEQQMRACIEFYLSYQAANRRESFVLWMEMRSLTPANFRTISRLQRFFTEKVRRIVERGVEAGQFTVDDCEIATYGLLQMLVMISRWYNPCGRIKPDTLIEIYTKQILRLLGVSDQFRPAVRDNEKGDGYAGCQRRARPCDQRRGGEHKLMGPQARRS